MTQPKKDQQYDDRQYVVQVSDEERARVMSMINGTYPFQSDQKRPKKEYPPENTVKYSKQRRA
jgi:hypothetical protein